MRALNGGIKHTATADPGVDAADRDRIPLDPDRTRATLEKRGHRDTDSATSPRTVGTAAVAAADIEGEGVDLEGREEMAVGRAMRESTRRPLECWAASDCLSGRIRRI